MKKFIGQLKVGDVIMIRAEGSRVKTAHTIQNIEFFEQDQEFEHAKMSLNNGIDQTNQIWYTVETVEVVS